MFFRLIAHPSPIPLKNDITWNVSHLPLVLGGSIWACRMEKPGAMMAGRVRERSSGGGTLRPPPPKASAAAAAAAAALWTKIYINCVTYLLLWCRYSKWINLLIIIMMINYVSCFFFNLFSKFCVISLQINKYEKLFFGPFIDKNV